MRVFSVLAVAMTGLLTVAMTVPVQAAGIPLAASPDEGMPPGTTLAAAEVQAYSAPATGQEAALQRSTYSFAATRQTSSSISIPFDQLNAVPAALRQGGLTLDEARAVIADYVSTSQTAPLRKGEAVLEALYPGGTGPGDCGNGRTVDKLDNCVGFVTYFMNVYTSFDRYVYANGGQEATNMAAALGRSTSSTPSVYSVGSDPRTSWAGHTFVVLGIQGDQAIIGEAACEQTDGWPRARAVPLSELKGDTFVNIADLLLPHPRTLGELIG